VRKEKNKLAPLLQRGVFVSSATELLHAWAGKGETRSTPRIADAVLRFADVNTAALRRLRKELRNATENRMILIQATRGSAEWERAER